MKRWFKVSYEADIYDGVLDSCNIILESRCRIAVDDIQKLTNGECPYIFAIRIGKGLFKYYNTGNGHYSYVNTPICRTPFGHPVECFLEYGEQSIKIDLQMPEKVVLYGTKLWHNHIVFDSVRESANCTHKILLTPKGYDVVGLGADRYCRVLDKASEFYGKLFSEVEDKEYLMQYYWKYRKKRCIDMDALASALGKSKMGGTSYMYCPKYICED
jgi:hypothetical protein